ncbi:RNA polymerase sigma factor [Streptomyces sp. SL13]|uniref:RNA polymerase sigma factor n=1 Tax=Streptantibioticus silvisoli TaxID=2705255 RepID=A0AA90JY38_9ACTN|nr:RNA polymerase sigma factor [Streptantibioticus silvisoli]MDI5970796.1 RNA polymerase sigma factor [Streptantibioticus silvisoli]
MEKRQDATPAATFDERFCGLLPRLYRRASLLAGQTAQDAVHETYLKLAARPERFLAHPEPYAYAFAALTSVVRDGFRRERRQVPLAEPEAQAPPVGGGGGWGMEIERRSAELEVVRLLSRLSVRQAAVVLLVDLDGYTIDQAAAILGLHRGTVSRTRARSLDKLRGVLTERRLSSAGNPNAGNGRGTCAADGRPTT